MAPDNHGLRKQDEKYPARKVTNPNVDQADNVDVAVAKWRQGDCVVGDVWFVHQAGIDDQLDDDDAESSNLVETLERGLAVLTQSCDIVRASKQRPYIEVSPLVEVSADDLRLIEHGRRPNYAYIPGVAKMHLVADLERVTK